MDPNKIYNRILDFIGFMMTLVFIILQVFKVISVSWWLILFPIILPQIFHVSEEDDD